MKNEGHDNKPGIPENEKINDNDFIVYYNGNIIKGLKEIRIENANIIINKNKICIETDDFLKGSLNEYN